MIRPITDEHAIRIARRLARHAAKADELLSRGVERRLWTLLDSHDASRHAYRAPAGVPLAEHAASMTAADLEAAAQRLATGLYPSSRKRREA